MSKRRLKQNPGQQKAKRVPQPIANAIAACKAVAAGFPVAGQEDQCRAT